jgi:hypothetical protein
MIPKVSPSMRLLVPSAFIIILSCACNPGEAANQTGLPDPAAASPILETGLRPAPSSTIAAKATKTASVAFPTLTTGRDQSCMSGPHGFLYEHIADIAEGETVSLLAKAPPEWEEYFFVRKSNGTECWAFGGSSKKCGDLAALPARDAPPLPSITLTIQNNTYLYVVDIFIRGKDGTDWGADRLAGSFIAPEGKTSLTLTAGFYDMQMKDSMGGILFDKADIPFGPESPYRDTVLDYEYLKVFLNLSETYFCRVVLRPLAGEIPINLAIPEDGMISPGEKVVLKAVAGFYEVRLRRCGDGAPAAILNTVYIGPIPSTQTIL